MFVDNIRDKLQPTNTTKTMDDLEKMSSGIKKDCLFNEYLEEASKFGNDKRFNKDMVVTITVKLRKEQIKFVQYILGEIGVIMDVTSQMDSLEVFESKQQLSELLRLDIKETKELRESFDNYKLLEMFKDSKNKSEGNNAGQK